MSIDRIEIHAALIRTSHSRIATLALDAPLWPVRLISKNGKPVALSRKVDRLTLRKI